MTIWWRLIHWPNCLYFNIFCLHQPKIIELLSRFLFIDEQPTFYDLKHTFPLRNLFSSWTIFYYYIDNLNKLFSYIIVYMTQRIDSHTHKYWLSFFEATISHYCPNERLNLMDNYRFSRIQLGGEYEVNWRLLVSSVIVIINFLFLSPLSWYWINFCVVFVSIFVDLLEL